MTAYRQGVAAPRLSWTIGLAFLATAAVPANGQPSATSTAFENAQYRYAAVVPAGCRHEEGPGTLDAICSPDLDPTKSAEASAAASLVFEVTAEQVPDDAGKPAATLAQRFGEGDFRQELPEMICGGASSERVRIDNLAKVVEDARVVYTADITCPEIKFLGLGERRASARYLITPGLRYRLMARALKEDYEQRKETIDAFFSSFKVLAEKRTP